MSDKPTSGLAYIGCAILAVPFAIVPAALLLGGSNDQQGQCAGAGAPAVSVVAGALPHVDRFSETQVANAAVIMKTAEANGLDRQAQLIGLITAKQESDLGADQTATTPDSNQDAGLFQLRVIPGWFGTLDQVNDPSYAATAFYLGHDITESGPGAAGPAGYHLPGLVDIKGWQQMTPTQAAQAVQGSDYPDAYAQHVPDAERLLTALSGSDVQVNTGGAAGCSTTVANGDVQAVIDRGRSILGTTYDFGGGSMDGPGPAGIDCSAFVAYAWTAAGYRDLPRTAQAQYDALAAYPVAVQDIQPGDLIYEAWGRRGSGETGISHVTMYIGNGQIIEASNSANQVRISTTRFNNPAFVGIRRVPSQQTPPA